MNFWKRKLAAFLHDPPEKAFDFGPAHHAAARSHAASFGVAELWDSLSHAPDWSAAAADRFILPDGRKKGVGGIGEEGRTAFVHPMSGRAEGQPSWKPEHFPTADQSTQWIGDIRPDWKDQDPQVLFLKAWRLWMDHAASHATGQSQGAGTLPYLPADTRVPDASIWHHCAVVSAIEGTRPRGDLKAPPQPAFLLFQVGPVQDFIAQTRSTRDLRNGSYLLSWLMMHAIKALADECGPDALIFPSLRGQPIYELLESRLGLRPDPQAALTPGIPNRFLALVPGGFEVAPVVKAFQEEWHRIARHCAAWLKSSNLDVEANPHWKEQIENHWHLTWQLWPWQSVNDALAALNTIPLGRKNSLDVARKVAMAIPAEHRDDRCYRNHNLDPGWAWSAHYQLCQHALDARRNLRDFKATAFDPTRKTAHRDAFSGREEAVLEEADLDKLAQWPEGGHLFRHHDPLGAPNLVKRVWHKAYLGRLAQVRPGEGLPTLDPVSESFDSVPAVAAAAFVQTLLVRTGQVSELREKLAAFARAAADARHFFSDHIAELNKGEEHNWVQRSDRGIFFSAAWEKEANRRDKNGGWIHSEAERKALLAAKAALDQLLFEAGATPPVYFAVLALDGDHIGKWLSGELTPPVGNVLAPKAVEYFKNTLPDWYRLHPGAGNAGEIADDTKKWLGAPRPISPSWHLQFSEALANFGLHLARRLVEEVHQGQLIYSGGDDVLAMLPADNAITCARDLGAAFQGRLRAMSKAAQALFTPNVPQGFLQLAQPSEQEPKWPLLMPGPKMTVSVGLAIGHIKEPLQDMIQEAQRAEKRAKGNPEMLKWDKNREKQSWTLTEGWGRDALALTLFKRNGETIRWGAKFSSPAFPLLAYMQKHYRESWDPADGEPPIRRRFPYRLAQLLGVYETNAPLTDDLQQIAEKELVHVISRQTATDDEARQTGSDFLRAELEKLCGAYLDELRSFSCDRPEENGPTTKNVPAPRPLREFIDLFLAEAFIRRQGD